MAIPVAIRRIAEAAGEHGWHALIEYDGPHAIRTAYTLHDRAGKVRQRYEVTYARDGNVWKFHHALEVIWYALPYETSRAATKAEVNAALRGT